MGRALVIKTYGDRDIAGAIIDGMALPPAKPLSKAEAATVQCEIDRQTIVRSLVRIAVNNTNTSDDYAAMITQEQYKRQRYEQPESIARKIGGALLVAWAVVWLLIYESADMLMEWNREG